MRKPGRPRQFTPQEAARRRRASKLRWRKKNRAKIRADQNAKNDRNRARLKKLLPPIAQIDTALTLIPALELHRPSLKYLDRNGVLHTEAELSAEELIALFERGKWRPT
jgi:hypothetical protein